MTGIGHFKKIDIDKVAQELSIQLEKEAKRIEAKKEDIEKALQNDSIDIIKSGDVLSETDKKTKEEE